VFSQYDWKWIGLLQNFVPCGVPYFNWTSNCIGWYWTVTVKPVLGDHLSVSRHVVTQNRWSFDRGLMIWLVNQSITDLRRFKCTLSTDNRLHFGLRVKYVYCTTPAVTLLLLLLQWETCTDCRDGEVSKLSGQSLMTGHITLQVNVNRRSLVALDRWSLTAGTVQWENNLSLRKWS